MDRPSEAEALASAWRALTGNADCQGWRTIPVAAGKSCRLLAGRHFPGNEEAVLFGFRPVLIPDTENLPEGNGFVIRIVDFQLESESRLWFALLHQAAGSLEMFTMMAADVVATTDSAATDNNEQLISIFLGRVRAWQIFMKRASEGMLSPEAEVGLYGELVLLKEILESGVPETTAIQSWRGPLDGIQDFQLGTGAIEVKTTTSIGGFHANITSLEQLDESLITPLFLAGVHLQLKKSGISLPELVEEIYNLLHMEPELRLAFQTQLLHAGFYPSMSERYFRRFSLKRRKIFPIYGDFPRLRRSDVSSQIQKARYEIDLDLLNVADVSLDITLHSLGVF